MCSKKEKLWLFVNHLGEYRYIVSVDKPKKFFVYDKELDHTEEVEPYHGSTTFKRNYYRYSDRKIYYWGFYPKMKCDYLPTTETAYFTPDLIGTIVPDILLKDEYLELTFDDEPLELPYIR